VKPEAGHFLAKAHKLLDEADGMLAMKYYDAAGRTAYLAGFHAAQAFIFEHNGRAAKTHNGVHTEFQRLTKDTRTLDPKLRAFLSQTYNLKSIADYETGPGSEVSPEKAAEAVEMAKRFVAKLAELVEDAAGSPTR
jgi:uncharacterized protein (UPF0332 family)